MSLVPLRDPAEFDESDQAALAAGQAGYGKALHTWQAIAQRPGMFGAYLPFIRAVAGPGCVDPRLKDLTAVYVTVLNHCRYSASHRCTSAAAQGATPEDIESVVSGNHAGLDHDLQLALELARVMTHELPPMPIAQAPTGLGDDLRAALTKTFSPDQLVELTMSISLWNALSRFHRVMDFDLDMPVPPEAVERVL
jgi:AhpD family alkylhydroperoxidase